MEKVLSVSASDYVKSRNKELTDYIMRGVHTCKKSFESVSMDVPDGTEMVVDYRVMGDSIYYSYRYGTALIPKDYFNKIDE